MHDHDLFHYVPFKSLYHRFDCGQYSYYSFIMNNTRKRNLPQRRVRYYDIVKLQSGISILGFSFKNKPEVILSSTPASGTGERGGCVLLSKKKRKFFKKNKEDQVDQSGWKQKKGKGQGRRILAHRRNHL